MTEIQNIAESLAAKHVLFVMDACYSGRALTRGAGSGSFARENAKRIGRQMLTAGGADQPVADGGPNGHSIFTWTFLQALAGKADLNGDRLITATEFAQIGRRSVPVVPFRPAYRHTHPPAIVLPQFITTFPASAHSCATFPICNGTVDSTAVAQTGRSPCCNV
jgi:hypothetical protein